MAKTLSGKVKKIPSTQVSADRYDYLQLSETEPDLGVPAQDGYFLTSTANGTRAWANPGLLIYSNLDGGNSSNEPSALIIEGGHS